MLVAIPSPYDSIAMIGTSDQSCWLAEACKILLLLLPCICTDVASKLTSVGCAIGHLHQIHALGKRHLK